MSPRVDRLIRHLSVAVAAGLVLAVAATAAYIARPGEAKAAGTAPESRPAYLAGETIDVPADWYGGAPHTLIVFARASCGACLKAHPFLRTLVAGMEGRGTAVMAHPPGTEVEDGKFAGSLGVTEANTHVVTRDMRVRATPTLVLVARDGTIVHAWEGVGPPEDHPTIAAAIDAALR